MEQRAAFLNNPLRGLFSGLDPRLRARGQYPPSTDEALAGRLLDRYLRNKKMTQAVAAAAGVKTVFVWQPVSVYRYDWNRHPLKGHGGAQPLPAVGARLMAARLREQPLGPDFVWAADIQDGVPDPLYVDSIHYAPNLSRALASVIASAIQERGGLR